MMIDEMISDSNGRLSIFLDFPQEVIINRMTNNRIEKKKIYVIKRAESIVFS